LGFALNNLGSYSVIDQIIKALLEADDEADWKDTVASAETAPWPETYAEEHYLYDEQGRVVRRSRNLRGIREYVSSMPVSHVMIQELDRGEGGVKVMFHNNWYWTGRFACFGVLKWALRNWRNLYGAPLTVNGQPAGQVGYRNAALIEAKEPEDFDPKELYDQPEEVSLEDMKRIEPEFFDRGNTRFFGTKKIYKYGNFIVLKNVRRMPGWFGGTSLTTSYVIYEFTRTEQNPQGILLHRQSTNELYKAKEMIKRRDFRPWREQLMDRTQRIMGESDEDDVGWKDVVEQDRDWVFRYEWIPNGKGYKLSVYFNKKFVGGEWLRSRNRSRLKWVEKQVREKDAVEPFSLERHKNIWNWLDLSQIESVTRELQPVWLRLLEIE
jgi:hypothetical protein